jgi:hypothetical protein
MAHELEYIATGALMKCSEGTMPMMPFMATPRNIRIQGMKVGTAEDTKPIVNIPSFIICQKLTKLAGGVPVPCVPAVTRWEDTYPVKINRHESLLFRSYCRCTSGQGKIEFVTSGQQPVLPQVSQLLQDLQRETNQMMQEVTDSPEPVGEAGFWEGMIPIWGSGRDMIHSIQTGNWGMAALNAAFLAYDVVSIGVGVVSFGTGTVAMQGAKGALRGALKMGLRQAARQGAKQLGEAATKKVAQQMAKVAAAKAALKAGQVTVGNVTACLVKACFAAGTPVAVETGYRAIEDLQAGDEVWAIDEQTGQLALKPVVAAVHNRVDSLVHLRVGGERLTTTEEHPFMTCGGWQRSADLQIGDAVYRSDGQWGEVSAVDIERALAVPVSVYNVEVADWHTYLVGKWQWLVHNAKICLWKLAREGVEYAQNMVRGINFNKAMEKRLKDGIHELWVDGMKYRLDTLIPGKKIISRKATQLADISIDTAKKYIDELVTKYKSGKKIQNAKRAGAEKLEGKYTLQIPKQEKPIPKEVLEHAENQKVTIEVIEDISMKDLEKWGKPK